MERYKAVMHRWRLESILESLLEMLQVVRDTQMGVVGGGPVRMMNGVTALVTVLESLLSPP